MTVDRYVIGSAEGCDIRITDDPYVSNRHCALTVDGDRVRVEDLGSTNGTWIAGHVRVWNDAFLAEGVELRVGRTVVPTDAVFAVAREAERRREDDELRVTLLASNPSLTGDQLDQLVVFMRAIQREADKAVDDTLFRLADILERKAAEAPRGVLAPGLDVAVKVIRATMEPA